MLQMLTHELLTHTTEISLISLAIGTNPIIADVNPQLFAAAVAKLSEKIVYTFDGNFVSMYKHIFTDERSILIIELANNILVTGVSEPGLGIQWTHTVIADGSFEASDLDQEELKALVKNYLYSNWPNDFYLEPSKHWNRLLVTSQCFDSANPPSWFNTYFNIGDPSPVVLQNVQETLYEKLKASGQIQAQRQAYSDYRALELNHAVNSLAIKK